MNHEDARQLIDAYIDRELDVLTAVEIERHLGTCDNCRALFTEYEQFHTSLKTRLPRFEAPKRLEAKVRMQMRSIEQDQRTERPRQERFPHWRMWTLAAGIAIIIALGALLVQTAKRQSASQMLAEQVLSGHIRSLLANHLTDIVSTDQHTVKPWFNGKLDFAPVVKDLSQEGFPLVGGRLDYLNDRSVAALVYKRRQHTINLFVWPSTDSDPALLTTNIKGYNIAHWTQAPMTYWAVSDLNAAELKEFAADLQK